MTLLIYLVPAYFTCYPPLGTSLPIPFTSNEEIPANVVDAFFYPARAFISMIGFQPKLKWIAGVVLVTHVVESLYTWWLCKRYVKGCGVTVGFLRAGLPRDVSADLSHLLVWMGTFCRAAMPSI